MTRAAHVNTRHEQGQFARARAVAEIEEGIQRDRAVHTVAGHSLDADDCRQLLAMLGLDASQPPRPDSP
jgi:hypothetical protein